MRKTPRDREIDVKINESASREQILGNGSQGDKDKVLKNSSVKISLPSYADTSI